MQNPNKILDLLYRYQFSRNLVYQILQSRATDLADKVQLYLKRGGLILDIGPASCTVTETLIKREFHVIPLDVENFSIVPGVLPTLYDGDKMPFKDDQFDTSIILFVLHHTPDPAEVLKEAKRVSKKILIFEDIVNSPAHKSLTAAFDSLMNLEFYDQPHTNKSDDEWRILFEELGLKLTDKKYSSSSVVMRHALYFLEK